MVCIIVSCKWYLGKFVFSSIHFNSVSKSAIAKFTTRVMKAIILGVMMRDSCLLTERLEGKGREVMLGFQKAKSSLRRQRNGLKELMNRTDGGSIYWQG